MTRGARQSHTSPSWKKYTASSPGTSERIASPHPAAAAARAAGTTRGASKNA